MLTSNKAIWEIVNPEGKKLTTEQWNKRFKAYEEKENAKREAGKETNELRPGACECGCTEFHLRALIGSGGKIERICKNEECKNKIIL